MERRHSNGKVMLAMAAGVVVSMLPRMACADEFTWQQIYKCAMFSSAVGEYAKSEGRNGDGFDKEWDRLMTVALQVHKKEYLGLRPNAKPEELRAAWELDTGAVERSYESDLDRSPDAREFLKQGYNQCAVLRGALLPRAP